MMAAWLAPAQRMLLIKALNAQAAPAQGGIGLCAVLLLPLPCLKTLP